MLDLIQDENDALTSTTHHTNNSYERTKLITAVDPIRSIRLDPTVAGPGCVNGFQRTNGVASAPHARACKSFRLCFWFWFAFQGRGNRIG